MSKGKLIKWKSIFVALIGLGLFGIAYVLVTLFAIPVTPIEYDAPPDLAQKVLPSARSNAVGTDEHAPVPAIPTAPAAPTFSGPADEEIEMVAKGVFFEGQSPELFLALFNHPDQDVRASAARALGRCQNLAYGRQDSLAGYTLHLEFWDKFWADADKPAILEALLEVISESGGIEFRGDDLNVLHSIASLSGQNAERAEILTWVANHHPIDHMRLSAVGYLLHVDDFPREIGEEALDSRAHDPSLMVRFGVWKERFSQIPFGFLGG